MVTRHVTKMADWALEKLEVGTDAVEHDSASRVKDLKDDLENQTTMLTTLADIYVHSGATI